MNASSHWHIDIDTKERLQMDIASTKLIQEVDELLATAGLAWIPNNFSGISCAEPFQVRTPLAKAEDFKNFLFWLSHRVGVSMPEYQDYLCGGRLKYRCSATEAAFLFTFENMVRLKNLLVAVFQDGLQPGFMVLK